jgi:hypothetical protein
MIMVTYLTLILFLKIVLFLYHLLGIFAGRNSLLLVRVNIFGSLLFLLKYFFIGGYFGVIYLLMRIFKNVVSISFNIS